MHSKDIGGPDTQGSTLVGHHTLHFFFGFMGSPTLHLYTSENSLKLDKVPMTLKESVMNQLLV